MPKISKKGPDRQGPKSQKAQARETQLFFIVGVVAAATVLIHLGSQTVLSVRNASRLEGERMAQVAGRALALYEDEQKFRLELSIAKDAATNQLAVKNHAAEMERRRARQKAFAASDREQAMLQMQALKPAEGEAPEEFLKKLAKLACPPKSGVGVTAGKAGWRVEVAFPYKGITERNSIYKNYLPGYYLEVRKTAAGIAQDILTYGATLGIEQVVVRCQNTVNIQSKDGVKKEKRDLFGIAIGNDGRDWSQYSRTEMEQLWNVTNNQFLAMIANMGATP